jgi:transposase InsO family protein
MRRSRRIHRLYDEINLRVIAGRLNTGEINLKGALAEVRYRGSRRRLTRQQLCNAFSAFEIPLSLHKGRPKVALPAGLDLFILQEQATHPVGVTRMIEHVRRDENLAQIGVEFVSSAMVRRVYEEQSLYLYHLPPTVHPVLRCRYEAVEVHAFWHTDLHLHGGRWVIAFIDDASRRVLGAAFLPSKHAWCTRDVLQWVIGRVGEIPYAIWSDNGTEFKGEFEAFLKAEEIRHVRTKPYNPQQNGKIERFWPTVEKWDDDGELMDWIEGYNNRPQSALPRMVQPSGIRVRMNPNDAYKNKPHWVRGTVPRWIVNGQCLTFPESLDAANPTAVILDASQTVGTFSAQATEADPTFSEEEVFEEPEIECEPEEEADSAYDELWGNPPPRGPEWEVDGERCAFGSTTPVEDARFCSFVVDWV